MATPITANLEKMQIEESDKKSIRSERYFQKLGANINGLLAASITDIGDIIETPLTEAQFQSLNGVNWVECNGQSIEPSELSSLTGFAFAPNLRGYFLQQANETTGGVEPGSLLNTTATDQNKSHSHFVFSTGGGVGSFFRQLVNYVISGPVSLITQQVTPRSSTKEPTAGYTSSTGSEFRPNNIALRYMIKINN